MTITLKQLRRAGACEPQVQLFKTTFGQSAEVNLETALKMAQKFDWNWAAANLLPAPAWKAYEEAMAPAWKAYDEARAQASKAYKEATAPAWKAYEEARATAFVNAALGVDKEAKPE